MRSFPKFSQRTKGDTAKSETIDQRRFNDVQNAIKVRDPTYDVAYVLHVELPRTLVTLATCMASFPPARPETENAPRGGQTSYGLTAPEGLQHPNLGPDVRLVTAVYRCVKPCLDATYLMRSTPELARQL